MTLEKHQEEVKKLKEMEKELTTLIINTNDGDLLSKYFLWQDQRTACNKGFVEFVDEALK